MKKSRKSLRYSFQPARFVLFALVGLLLAAPVFGQTNSPWENAVNVLQQAFTSTIARGLSLVAIVVSGLTFAFGEGGSKRVLAGVLFAFVALLLAAPAFAQTNSPWENAVNVLQQAFTSTIARGLSLVAALSHEWGATPLPAGGKCVWADLRLPG